MYASFTRQQCSCYREESLNTHLLIVQQIQKLIISVPLLFKIPLVLYTSRLNIDQAYSIKQSTGQNKNYVE